LQPPYKRSKGSVQKRMGSEPLLSAYLPRRFAALNSTSLAHVTGLASSDSAAVSTCCFSASVIGMSMADVLRSLGFLGGLPRLFSMPLNISIKIVASTLATLVYSIYNKSRGQGIQSDSCHLPTRESAEERQDAKGRNPVSLRLVREVLDRINLHSQRDA